MQFQLEQVPDHSEEWWEQEYERRQLMWAAEKARSEFDSPTYESFRRFYLDGEKLHSIADSLGTNVSAVFNAKERVLDRIRAILTEVAGDDSAEGRP